MAKKVTAYANVVIPVPIVRAEAIAIPPTIRVEQPLLLQAIIEPGAKTHEGVLIRAVALPWFAIVKRILDDPSFVYQFAQHPRKFEEFLAACYRQAGYQNVVLTPASGDLGIDVIVVATLPGAGTIRFVDQAKACSAGKIVSANDVRAITGVLYRERHTHKGIITTTATFAKNVGKEFQHLIRQQRLILKDHDKLLDWLREIEKQKTPSTY
jgi:restriction system protein